MAKSILNPRIRKTTENTQLTYNFERRINDVQTYPTLSPQGASIVIYSHDEGVGIIWRGGRRLKTSKAAASRKSNGTTEDNVMVLDSDEDELSAAATKGGAKFVDKPEFEEEEEQVQYPSIIQTVDLKLESPALRLATLSIPSDGAQGSAAGLQGKLVFAVACSNKKSYIITLPSTPPSAASKERPQAKKARAGDGTWGETIAQLGGISKLTDGFAITLAAPRSNAQSARVIVAAYDREASGTLRLWEVPLDLKTSPKTGFQPFQLEYLPSPLSGLSFNPTHSTQLLTISASQGVRIYDYNLPSLPDPSNEEPFPSQGSWLLTLYQPFSRPSAHRKPLLDAAWISHGRAILALLADGMWGIWDVDGTSPSSSGSNMSSKLKSGVRGAALTAFSVSGYVDGTSPLRSAVSHVRESSNSGEFAPMTPHTRRQATASLGASSTMERLHAMKGGIAVRKLPAVGGALPDECVALWIAGLEHVCVIPGLTRFWDTQLRKAADKGAHLFSGATPTRIIRVADLSTGLLGERCCGVSLVSDHGTGEAEGSLPVDVLVRGESRLVAVRREDSPGDLKSGGILATHKRRLFSGQRNKAIIVHGEDGRSNSKSYNLSTAQPGSLRRPAIPRFDESDAGEGEAASTKGAPARGVGFDFMDTLDAAADGTEDFASRNLEVEMLDIMDIDKALDGMGGARAGGQKKVLFQN